MRDYFEGFLLIILFLAALSSQASESTLKIKEFSEVWSGSVKIKNISEPVSLTPESEAIMNLEVARAPAAGEKITFTARAISQLISRHIGSKNLKLIIPNQVVIQGAGWEASIKTLENQIKKQTELQCNRACEVEIIEISGIPPHKSQYGSDARVEVDSLATIPKGSFNLPLRVVKDGKVLERGWVQGRLRVFQNVPVAKKLLQSGWRIEPDDYEVRRSDITMQTDVPVDTANLIGAKLIRTLSPNQVILSNAIAREKDLAFGQNVKAMIRNKNWNVSVEGFARDSGSIGDTVKVYNPVTKKTLTGVLVSKGIVEIK